MSGTAYSQCPRCLILAADFDRVIEERVDSYYGKVSRQQFKLIQKQAKKIENPYSRDCSSLREDYSAHVDKNGTLKFGYLGLCDVCGYEIAGGYEKTEPPQPTVQDGAAKKAIAAFEALHIVETDE